MPTCGVTRTVAEVRPLLEGSDLGFVLVADDEGLVLGKVLREDLDVADDTPVAEVMLEGPTSVRASQDLEDLLERMGDAETESVILTSKEGRLLGVLVRDEAERWLSEHANDDEDPEG